MFDFIGTPMFAILAVVVPIAAIVTAGHFLFKNLRGLTPFQPRGFDKSGFRAERNRQRLEIASIRINAWALLLISIVGIGQIGFEIWRLSLNEQRYVSAPALEQLLRTKLLDPDAQERQHKDVVDAIREARPSDSTIAVDQVVRAELSDLQTQVNRHEEILASRPVKTEPALETSPAVASFFPWRPVLSCSG